MIRHKALKVAVVLVCVAAFAAPPAFAWGDAPDSRATRGEGYFSPDAFSWLAAAWNRVLSSLGAGTELESSEKALAPAPIVAEEPDGGTNGAGTESGGAGPGIDPDGSP